jgi:5-methylcytosine-specific restriction endonuclease McrA
MEVNSNKRSACRISGLKYPSSDNVKNRTSTIARAMACTLTHRIPCSPEDEKKWVDILCPEGKELKCAYCGAKATHLDHLHPLIKGVLPTGYGTEPGNLVPCCKDCNQNKGNMDWKDFMDSKFCKHVDNNKESRIKAIRNLLDSFKPIKINWDANKEFLDDWKEAYHNCVEALQNAQKVLEEYKARNII